MSKKVGVSPFAFLNGREYSLGFLAPPFSSSHLIIAAAMCWHRFPETASAHVHLIDGLP